VLVWQFILFAVIHAAGSKGLSSPNIATSSSLSTPTAATEEGDCGKGNVPETHDTDGSDEPNDETLVLIAFARVEVTVHTVVGGGVSVEVGVDVVGRVIVG